MKQVFIILLTFFISNNLFAQDTLSLTNEDAINIALKKSYSIKEHLNEKDAMYHSYKYNKNMFKPRLDMNLNVPAWDESVNKIERPDGLPVYNTTSSLMEGGNLNFSYTLPTGGSVALYSNMFRNNTSVLLEGQSSRLYDDLFQSSFGVYFRQPVFTKNILRENLKEAEYKYKKSVCYFSRKQLDIIYKVTMNFYFLYKSGKEVDIAAEKLANSKESYRVAVLKSKSGRIPKVDVLAAEVNVIRDNADMLKSQNSFKNDEEKFKQLIGLDLNQKLKIITDTAYSTFEIDSTKAVEQALKNRFELKENELEIQLQNINIDRAKRDSEFKGYISAYYDLTGVSTLGKGTNQELINSSFADMSNRPHNRGVSFTLTFPIYDWGRRKEKVQEARIGLNEQKLQRENLKITIIREVNEVIRTVRESRNRIKIYKKNLELAKKTYNIYKMRFESGDISNQALSIERERLADIQLEYLNSFITYNLAINNLKKITMWDFENNKSYINTEKTKDI